MEIEGGTIKTRREIDKGRMQKYLRAEMMRKQCFPSSVSAALASVSKQPEAIFQ